MSYKANPILMQKLSCIDTIRTTITQLSGAAIDAKHSSEIALFIRLKKQIQLMEKLYELPTEEPGIKCSEVKHGAQPTITFTNNKINAE